MTSAVDLAEGAAVPRALAHARAVTAARAAPAAVGVAVARPIARPPLGAERLAPRERPLVGQRHDLQRWVEDERRPPAGFSIRYRSALPTLPASLPWVGAVLDPVRAAHFPSLQLLAASTDLSSLLAKVLRIDVSSKRVRVHLVYARTF